MEDGAYMWYSRYFDMIFAQLDGVSTGKSQTDNLVGQT